MPLYLALAWRNMWRHQRRTWLTVSAMTLCNCILIFMISLQAGSYMTMLNNSLAVLSGHLQIQHKDYLAHPTPSHSVPDGVSLANTLRATPGVQAAAARGVSFALVSSQSRTQPMQIIGVESEHEPSISSIPGTLQKGQYLGHRTANGIILGTQSAKRLNVDLDDELTLLGTGRDGSFAASIVTVIGIVDSGMEQLDRSTAFIRLEDFQEIFSFGNDVSYISVISPSIFDVPTLQTEIDYLLPKNHNILNVDWNSLMPGLKQAILSDVISALFIYAVLIIVVVFSVLNNQLMAVLERRKEYGILLSLGIAHRRLITLLFIETVLLALLGLILGVTLGGFIDLYFSHAGIAFEGMEQMAEKFNLPSRIHPLVHPVTLFLGPLIVFFGSVSATIYPAFKLHRLHPVSARAGL